MKPVSEVHFRVVDKGLFLPVAQRLARDGARTSYWSPHDRAFPTVRDLVGEGFEGIERVESPFQNKEEVDCFVFPDVGFSWEQHTLIEMGFPVWGARFGDSLETMRGKFLHTLQFDTDLPVPKHQKIVGIDKLREHLREREDVYIKISRYRGDMETFHWRSWDLDSNTIDHYAVRFGPFRNLISFYVFDKIDTDIEDGCDAWSIDGQWPSLVIHGMESKDKAYLGTWQKYEDLPEELRVVNEQFGPVLRKFEYRSFFSTEVRIKGKESNFIDPTCRCGSPPSQCMAEMIKNYGDIIWNGAHGIMIEPEPAFQFGVQGLLFPERDSEGWEFIRADKKMDQWIKCGHCCKVDDQICFPPSQELNGQPVGWLVGVGNTINEAIDHLRGNTEELPDGACCEFSALADLLKEVQEAEKQGMEFTDQKVPEPSAILEP